MKKEFRCLSAKAASIVLSLSLILSGCGGADPTKSNNAKSDDVKSTSTEVTLNIATVENPDMIIMQNLSSKFTEKTGIKLKFTTVPENELRQKVTEDVGIGAGKFDIVTIGSYDTPFWGKQKWIENLEPYFSKMTDDEKKNYDREDHIKSVRSALSSDGAQYSLPFYAESSLVFYRTDLFEAAGIKMPEKPTWTQIYEYAKKLHDPKKGIVGICLRGLPGWGQNICVFGTIFNAFGAKWFDMDWKSQWNSSEAKSAMEFYKKIQTEVGQPNPDKAGYTESLKLMMDGKAAMWYDASVSAGTLASKESKVAGKIGYALAPSMKKENTGWMWAWALGIESASKNKDAAFKFITWATSKEYTNLVGEQVGWAQAPSGTRESTYSNPKYLEAAPFAKMTINAIKSADYNAPTIDKVPYIGVQYVSIPEFQELGGIAGQNLRDYLIGKKTVEEAMKTINDEGNRIAKEGKYQK